MTMAPTGSIAPTPVEPDLNMARRRRGGRGGSSLFAHGEPMVWLSGGSLAVCLFMIISLLAIIVFQGVKTFWPGPLHELTLIDGTVYIGEQTREESYTITDADFDKLPPAEQELVTKHGEKTLKGHRLHRRLFRTGNFELTNEHFHWVSDYAIASETFPEWAVLLEREKNGRFYGKPLAVLHVREWQSTDSLDKLKQENPQAEVLVERDNGYGNGRLKVGEIKPGVDLVQFVILESWDDPERSWNRFQELHDAARDRVQTRHALEKHELGALSRRIESARLSVTSARLKYGADSDEHNEAVAYLDEVAVDVQAQTTGILEQIEKLNAVNRKYGLFIQTCDNRTKHIEIADIVRGFAANRLSTGGKTSVYASRWGEFLTDDPREANSEGGVWPAIFGTVVMTIIMSIAVVPFGVLAALYLREYAKGGFVVSSVRIAINNLAGVPSIVFGVFGLGFFCYHVGKFADGGAEKGLGIAPWSSTGWVLGLVGLLLLVALAIFCGFFSAQKKTAEYSKGKALVGKLSVVLWISIVALAVLLVIFNPQFDGFFRAKLEQNNSPTFGTGGLFWASLTLALLTLPVVIVATEEALSAVPSSMREGSYACGASKWQTIKRIVLPRAMPGIMTGMILAMARGAGEVAPLMLVGAVKLAPQLPVDGVFPYVHAQRSFMHLGFHIYDVGFQSQNSEAAKPMVYTTTLLLILIIATLNVTAIWLRARLKKKFIIGQF